MLVDDYRALCNKHDNKVIVAYQNGKFFEIFEWEDGIGKAKLVSDLLDFKLTRRSKKEPYSYTNPFMVGFPIFTKNEHTKTIIEKGYEVVFYTQNELNGEYIRSFDEYISPGTYSENPNNTILCIYQENTMYGLCSLNISLGSIEITECYNLHDVYRFLSIWNPSEIICYGNTQLNYNTNIKYFEKISNYHNKNYQNNVINELWKDDLDYLNLEYYNYATNSLIYCLNYCNHVTNIKLEHLQKPHFYVDKYCILQQNTCEELNVKELWKLIDKTYTPMGKRLLYKQLIYPFNNVKDISKLHSEINMGIYYEIKDDLKTIGDLEKSARRIFTKKVDVCELMKLLPELYSAESIYKKFVDCDLSLYDYLNNILDEKRLFKVKFNKEYDKCLKSIEEVLNELTNITKTWNIVPSIQNTDNIVLSFTPSQFRKLKNENVFQKSNTKSVIYVSTYEIEQLNHKYVSLLNTKETLIKTLLNSLIDNILLNYKDFLIDLHNFVAYRDTILCRKILIDDYKYILPTVTESDDSFIHVKQLKHPILDIIQDIPYIPNDININNGILLYGVNGCGKSCFTKAVGLSVLLAQSGFGVPCESMIISPFHQIFSRVRCDDNMFKGESSFAVEMKELKSILHNSDHNTLVLGDEICKGTEYKSANTIVQTIIKILQKRKTKFIFSTHLHELPNVISDIDIYHFNVEFIQNDVVYSRKLIKGQGSTEYGLNIAKFLLENKEFDTISNKLTKSKSIISTKKSAYNSTIYMNKCEICESKESLETHHIIPQVIAPEKKSVKSNLVCICDECHKKVHSNKLVINGWKRRGRKNVLDYYFL